MNSKTNKNITYREISGIGCRRSRLGNDYDGLPSISPTNFWGFLVVGDFREDINNSPRDEISRKLFSFIPTKFRRYELTEFRQVLFIGIYRELSDTIDIFSAISHKDQANLLIIHFLRNFCRSWRCFLVVCV